MFDPNDIRDVLILRRKHATDLVFIHLTDEAAHRIHEEYYSVFGGADFRLEVTKGRGEMAVKALGLNDVPCVIREMP